MIRVVIHENAFNSQPARVLDLPAIGTVPDLLTASGIEPGLHPLAYVSLNGEPVAFEHGHRVRPKDGTQMDVVLALAGPLQGLGMLVGNDTLRLAFSLVANIGGALLGQYVGGAGGALLGAGVSVGGVLAINALIPPPVEAFLNTASVTGSQSAMRVYEPVPVLFGESRLYPPLAAQAYTEVGDKNEQYLRLVYVLGHWPLHVEDFRIGDTPIKDYVGRGNVEGPFIEVTGGERTRRTFLDEAPGWEILPPPTAFNLNETVNERSLSVALEHGDESDGKWYTQVAPAIQEFPEDAAYYENVRTGITSGERATGAELAVDITFPNGLYWGDQDNKTPQTVTFEIQYRLAGSGDDDESGGWMPVTFTGEANLDLTNHAQQTPDQWPNWIDEATSWLEDRLAAVQAIASVNRRAESGWVATFERSLLRALDKARDLRERYENEDEEPAIQGLIDVLQNWLNESSTNWLTAWESRWAAFDMNVNWAATVVESVNALTDVIAYLQQPGIDPIDLADYPMFISFWLNRQNRLNQFDLPEEHEFWVRDAYAGTVRRTVRWYVTPGQYEVRVRRVTPDYDDDSPVVDDAQWTALRSIRHIKPVKEDGLVIAHVRIKADEQLSGMVDRLNCLARAYVPVWTDGASAYTDWPWSYAQARNPAWQYLSRICDPRLAKRPMPLSRVDVDAIKDWAAACVAETDLGPSGRVCDLVIDRDSTTFEVLKTIASVGRAAFAMSDTGRYSVLRDMAQTDVVQHFSPRNSWGFTSQKHFADETHGLKLRFMNSESDYQEDEIVVYNKKPDGTYWSEADATIFEEMQFPGYPTAKQAYKDGRFHLGAFRLRPERFAFETDVEHLACGRGSLIRVAHDAPMWGLGYGRVKSVGPGALSVVLDEPMPMELAKNYAVRFRLGTSGATAGDTIVCNVVSLSDSGTEGFYDEIELESAATGVAQGDLFLFGERGTESVELIVLEVQPGDDLTSKLICIDHAPELYDEDLLDLPDYDPQITKPPDIETARPPEPRIASIRSDESVLVRAANGDLQTRIVIDLVQPNARPNAKPAWIEAQFRLSGNGYWGSAPNAAADANRVSIYEVQDGDLYDIRLRYVTLYGATGPWTEVTHTVIGKTTPPQDITEIDASRNLLVWRYPNPPRDLKGFRVRYKVGPGVNWDGGVPAHDGIVTATTWDMNALPRGTITVMVKAVDTSGNESVNAAWVTKELGDFLIDNVIYSSDHHGTWPGTKIRCYQDGNGDLVANDVGEVFWGALYARFWQEDVSGNYFWDTVYADMEYIASITITEDLLPSFIKLEIEATGDYLVEYKRGDAVPEFWPESGPLWPADRAMNIWPDDLWLPWPGKVELESGVYQVRVRVFQKGPLQPGLQAFRLIVDVPDIEEHHENMTISDGQKAAGVRIAPLQREYRAIKHVTLTLQFASGDTAYSMKVLDKDEVDGPLVKAFTEAGADATATFDALIKGY